MANVNANFGNVCSCSCTGELGCICQCKIITDFRVKNETRIIGIGVLNCDQMGVCTQENDTVVMAGATAADKPNNG